MKTNSDLKLSVFSVVFSLAALIIAICEKVM
jgi:hypothetical protein